MTEQAQRTATAAGGTEFAGPVGERPRRSLWTGWIWFAAFIMILIGLFNLMYGVVALVDDDYYSVGREGLLVLDLTGWGWVHVAVGALILLTGFALLGGSAWARVLTVVLVVLNALAQVAFLPAYPTWSTIVIVLNILVIWAVVVHGGEMRSRRTG